MENLILIKLTSSQRDYTIGRQLGEGNFGRVYFSGHHSLPPVAIKIFNEDVEARKELEIATDICNINPKGLVKLLDHGFIESQITAQYFEVAVGSMFLVYEYINKSLKDLWDGAKMPTKDIIQIGIQLIESAESIHSAGYVHADLKLDNVMVDKENKVYLIDYGCAQKYKLPDGSHRLNGSGPNLFTNVHFGSKNALHKQTISRRDDLIQIVYNLICLKNSFLPLRDYLPPDNDDLDEFKKFKMESSAREFCKRNNTRQFIEILNECYGMLYDETPNYTKLKFMLKKIILNMNKLPGGKFLEDHP